MPKFTCHTALITGASSGIGAEFARHLAKPDCTLILVARHVEHLQSMKTELEKSGTTVETLPADLATEEGIQAVAQKIKSLPELDLLINNAGFGITGAFASEPLEALADMLRVHDEAPMRLTHAALQGMLTRKQGAIINVSSISGFLSMGGGVMYGATKAFLNTFSMALHKGLRGTGVKIQVLCPGFTHTEFHEPNELMKMDTKKIPAFMWMDAREVTAVSLKALERNQAVVVPGILFKITVLLARLGLI
jgi:short-subunit dehydrogenase